MLRLPKLKTALFVLLTLTALTAVSGIQWKNYSDSFANELKLVEQKHLLVANNLSLAIERYLKDIGLLSELYWTQMDQSASWRDEYKKSLADFGIRAVGRVDQNGEIILQYVTPGITAETLATNEAFREAVSIVRRDGKANVSNLISLPQFQGAAIVTLRQKGIYFTVLPLDYVRQIQKSIQFGELGHSAIVDRHGVILAHPSQKLEEKGASLAKLPIVVKMMNGESGVSTFFSPPMNADMIAGHTTVQGVGWGIMVPQPMREIKADALANIQKSNYLALILLVFLITFSYLLSSLLTRPLAKGVESLKKIAHGGKLEGDPSVHYYKESMDLENALLSTAEQVRNSQKRLASALAQARSNVEKQNQFIDHMNHQIRTPLNIISGSAILLEPEMDESELTESQEQILHGVTEITHLIEGEFKERKIAKESV